MIHYHIHSDTPVVKRGCSSASDTVFSTLAHRYMLDESRYLRHDRMHSLTIPVLCIQYDIQVTMVTLSRLSLVVLVAD